MAEKKKKYVKVMGAMYTLNVAPMSIGRIDLLGESFYDGFEKLNEKNLRVAEDIAAQTGESVKQPKPLEVKFDRTNDTWVRVEFPAKNSAFAVVDNIIQNTEGIEVAVPYIDCGIAPYPVNDGDDNVLSGVIVYLPPSKRDIKRNRKGTVRHLIIDKGFPFGYKLRFGKTTHFMKGDQAGHAMIRRKGVIVHYTITGSVEKQSGIKRLFEYTVNNIFFNKSDMNINIEYDPPKVSADGFGKMLPDWVSTGIQKDIDNLLKSKARFEAGEYDEVEVVKTQPQENEEEDDFDDEGFSDSIANALSIKEPEEEVESDEDTPEEEVESDEDTPEEEVDESED